MTKSEAARQKLKARVAAMSLQQLKDTSLLLVLATKPEEIIVANFIEDELCERMPEAEFVAHCANLEAILDAA